MASNITAQSVLEEISQDHLECPICTERFKQPKLLRCSHTFCLECLQQLKKKSPSTTTLTCPVCRQETNLLNANGIDDLKTNFIVLSLIEAIEKQETQLKQQQRKRPRSQEFVSRCSKHKDKDLNMFCNTCNKVICTTCIVRDHQSHSLMEINEASDKCKQHAIKLLASVRQSINTFNIAIQEIDTSRKTLDSMFAATKEKMSKKADEEIAKEVEGIKEEKQRLMQEAEQIYKERVKTMEAARATNINEMNKAELKRDEVNLLLDQRIEVVHHTEQLLQDLKDYREMKSTKVPDGLTYMDFKEGQKSLGRLVLKDDQQVESATFSAHARMPTLPSIKSLKQNKWTVKSEMYTIQNIKQQMVRISPLYVAVYSDGDIIVSDRNSDSLFKISAKSNPKVIVIPQELSIKGLTRPIKVTANKDELIVLDNDTVKIFNRNYKLLHQFNPDSEPSCIAVDDNNLIALGHSIKAEIFLYKQDGSLVRTLPAPGIGDYLTTYKQRLIYTNLAKGKLVSVDYNGKVVFSVDINHSYWPSGVCCDNCGSIYMCVTVRKAAFSFSPLGEIHHYSPDGRFIGCIIKG